jgi:hypothetical protein
LDPLRTHPLLPLVFHTHGDGRWTRDGNRRAPVLTGSLY